MSRSSRWAVSGGGGRWLARRVLFTLFASFEDLSLCLASTSVLASSLPPALLASVPPPLRAILFARPGSVGCYRVPERRLGGERSKSRALATPMEGLVSPIRRVDASCGLQPQQLEQLHGGAIRWRLSCLSCTAVSCRPAKLEGLGSAAAAAAAIRSM